jgi:hypothetical protein
VTHKRIAREVEVWNEWLRKTGGGSKVLRLKKNKQLIRVKWEDSSLS